jgi:hypothetical protein
MRWEWLWIVPPWSGNELPKYFTTSKLTVSLNLLIQKRLKILLLPSTRYSEFGDTRIKQHLPRNTNEVQHSKESVSELRIKSITSTCFQEADNCSFYRYTCCRKESSCLVFAQHLIQAGTTFRSFDRLNTSRLLDPCVEINYPLC